jgi:hypothetical protein
MSSSVVPLTATAEVMVLQSALSRSEQAIVVAMHKSDVANVLNSDASADADKGTPAALPSAEPSREKAKNASASLSASSSSELLLSIVVSSLPSS